MADKYQALINGVPQGVEATEVSGGVSSGGKILALKTGTGRLDNSVLPPAATAQVCDNGVAAANLAAGDWVVVYDLAGVTMVDKANAASPTRRCVGYVDASYSLNATGVVVILGGSNTGDTYFAGDVGKIVYLSETLSGKSSTARPVTSGNRYQELGVVIRVGAAFVVSHFPSGMESII